MNLKPQREVQAGNREGRPLDSCWSAQCGGRGRGRGRVQAERDSGGMRSTVMGERKSESGWYQTPRGGQSPERGTSGRDVQELRPDLGLDQDEGLVDFDLRGSRKDEVRARGVPIVSQHMKQLGAIVGRMDR